MTKAEKNELPTMMPEQLIESFVRETKLHELGPVSVANKAIKDKIAIAEVIVRRGGAESLLELTASSDPFLAFSAADRLADLPEFRDRALAVLDRLADAQLGKASYRAQVSRNMVRWGTLEGDPVQYEKELAAIRARTNRG